MKDLLQEVCEERERKDIRKRGGVRRKRRRRRGRLPEEEQKMREGMRREIEWRKFCLFFEQGEETRAMWFSSLSEQSL